MENLNTVLLGVGEFTWDAAERRTDRYGSVRLNNGDECVLFDCRDLLGRRGRLFAEVVTPVKSSHPGDLARGIKTSTPEAGEVVNLGSGRLFVERRGVPGVRDASHSEFDALVRSFAAALAGDPNVRVRLSKSGNAGPGMAAGPVNVYDILGVEPGDGRAKDWLDPHAFYRLHTSVVRLLFTPEAES